MKRNTKKRAKKKNIMKKKNGRKKQKSAMKTSTGRRISTLAKTFMKETGRTTTMSLNSVRIGIQRKLNSTFSTLNHWRLK